MLVMMSYFLPAPLPSKATLRNVFENTKDLNKLCFLLHIPNDRRDVDSAVEYFEQSSLPMKMRWMIFTLDVIGDTALANSVVDYAESPAGMTQ